MSSTNEMLVSVSAIDRALVGLHALIERDGEQYNIQAVIERAQKAMDCITQATTYYGDGEFSAVLVAVGGCMGYIISFNSIPGKKMQAFHIEGLVINCCHLVDNEVARLTDAKGIVNFVNSRYGGKN